MKKKLMVRGLCLLCILAAVFFLFSSGIIVLDHSAEQRGQDTIYWNGSYYDTCTGEYREGKTIAKTSDGSWDINEVRGDPSHTFLVMRSFLDQYLLVKREYEIPTSGTVTAAVWYGREPINDKAFCQAISKIFTKAEGRFTYKTDGIFQLVDGQQLYPLYLAYENCPLATEFMGYMGTLNDQWIITTHISYGYTPEGGLAPDVIQYDVVPDEYVDILKFYFK